MALGCVELLSVPASAQQSLRSLVGAVRDASGMLVASVKVEVSGAR
jgi:hypothetical protein